MSSDKRKSKSQKVFSPKFDFIFRKLFIENGESQYKYFINLLNTIYNYDKKDKKAFRIRHIEFIKNMDNGIPYFNAGNNDSIASPNPLSKHGDKYFKTNNIFNRFTDPRLNENKTFLLDCICYVSDADIDNPALETVSTGQSFLLHVELRDRVEYNDLDIINYINNQIKYQQILYFQQNMLDLVSPKTPTTPSSSKFSCFKKIPNIRSLFFLKNQEANTYPCLYHVNPVIFDNSLKCGSLDTEDSPVQYFESSTVKDLTTVIQLSKINETDSNVKNPCLKDWLNFINIGNRKGLLITEKTAINMELFQSDVVKELANYLINISNNGSITNELLSTKGILHNMKVIEENAKMESILRMILVLTEDNLMDLEMAKNKARKMYPSYLDFIDDLTEEELDRKRKLLESNNNGLFGNGEFMSESDDDSDSEWEFVNVERKNSDQTVDEGEKSNGIKLVLGDVKSKKKSEDNKAQNDTSFHGTITDDEDEVKGGDENDISKNISEVLEADSIVEDDVSVSEINKNEDEKNEDEIEEELEEEFEISSIENEPSQIEKMVDNNNNNTSISNNKDPFNSNEKTMEQSRSNIDENDIDIHGDSALLSDLSSVSMDDEDEDSLSIPDGNSKKPSNPIIEKKTQKVQEEDDSGKKEAQTDDEVSEIVEEVEVDENDNEIEYEEEEIEVEVDENGNEIIPTRERSNSKVIKREIDEDGNIVEYEEQVVEVDEDGNEVEVEEVEVEVDEDGNEIEYVEEEIEIEVDEDGNEIVSSQHSPSLPPSSQSNKNQNTVQMRINNIEAKSRESLQSNPKLLSSKNQLNTSKKALETADKEGVKTHSHSVQKNSINGASKK